LEFNFFLIASHFYKTLDELSTAFKDELYMSDLDESFRHLLLHTAIKKAREENDYDEIDRLCRIKIAKYLSVVKYEGNYYANGYEIMADGLGSITRSDGSIVVTDF